MSQVQRPDFHAPETIPPEWVALAHSRRQEVHHLEHALAALERRQERRDRIDVLVHTAAVAPGSAQALCGAMAEDELAQLPWLLVRGVILNREQQLFPAARLLGLVVTEARLHGDVYLLLWGLLELARAQGMSGQLSRATENLREALSILAEHPCDLLKVRALITMGMLYTQEGEHTSAAEYNTEALQLSRGLGDPQATAHCLSNLAETFLRQGTLDASERCYVEALSMVEDKGWIRTKATVLAGSGTLDLVRGRHGRGLTRIENSNRQLEALGDHYQVARQELWLVEFLAEVGRADEAIQLCRQAIARCQERGLGHIESQCWNLLGGIFTALGQHEQATGALQQCITRMRSCVEERVAATQLAEERSHMALRTFHEAVWERRQREELERQNRALARALMERERLQVELERASLLDPLTGAGNRRAFNRQLETFLALSAREGRALTLVILDVDHFKEVNDTHGHMIGDEVLRQVCARVRKRLRVSDFFARWGGEEFVFLLYGTGLEGGYRCADDLRRCVAERPFETESGPIEVTVSLGLATVRSKDDSGADLIQRADQGLLQAKRSGRNCVVVGNAVRASSGHKAASRS